jgi:ArsR family metal-binding transcriptional regulator
MQVKAWMGGRSPDSSGGAKGEMEDNLFLTTFPIQEELEKVVEALNAIGAAYKQISPSPALSRVAVPALVMSREVRGRLHTVAPTIVFSGWVDYRIADAVLPDGPSPDEEGICFRRAAIMVLAPCVADETKIRMIAHLDGDLGPVLPYLNAVMPTASYAPTADLLTFMDGYRMITLYRQRITIAKADEIVDGWLTLERIRRVVEQTWGDRNRIEPSYEIRKRPPALEIFKRLPRTNCGRCGQPTCLAFALRLWAGEGSAGLCLPVFEDDGAASHLKEALSEICAGMGLTAVSE